MKSKFPFAVLVMLCAWPVANAGAVSLYVDSAPNVYGSPDYAAWAEGARAGAIGGTFVNMGNSVDPANAGTTDFAMVDAVVCSFGDLGRRLSFLYWIPDTTIEALKAGNFGIGLSYVWDGATYDFYQDYYGSTWLTPASWIETDGGVFGVAGFAWWGAYGVNTPEALAADLAAWDPYQGDITFSVKLDGRVVNSLTAHHPVPDGGITLLLLGFSCVLLGRLRRRTAH